MYRNDIWQLSEKQMEDMNILWTPLFKCLRVTALDLGKLGLWYTSAGFQMRRKHTVHIVDGEENSETSTTGPEQVSTAVNPTNSIRLNPVH